MEKSSSRDLRSRWRAHPFYLVFVSVLLMGFGTDLSAGARLSEETERQAAGQSGRRAEELRRRRLMKSRKIEPDEDSGVKKFLLYAEDKGFDRLLNFRYKDFYPKFGNLSRGSGLALGPRFFRSGLGGAPLSVESSGAFSFSGYKQADLQFGYFNKIAPSVFLTPSERDVPAAFTETEPARRRKGFLYGDFRYRYFPREDFYGLGRGSSEDSRTDFLLEDASYDLVGGYQPKTWLGFAVRVGYLQTNVDGGSDDRFPDTNEFFAPGSVPGLAEQPAFLHLDAMVFLDYRDVSANPHSGGMVAVSFSRFDDRGASRFEFNRYTLDARHFLPLGSKQRVLAVRFYTSVEDSDEGSQIPFYLQRTLGGAETIRGFREFRFRDSNLILLSAEYRWEAAPALEFAVFYDAGKTFPESEDYDLNHLRKSIGAGVRFKTSGGVFLRIDVGRSEEDTLIHLRFGPSF